MRHPHVAFGMILLLALATGRSHAQLVAFPGAEGEGRFTTGGRGGDVYHVTNLNDSGAGSLRYGLDSASGSPRTIVFDVSGTIALSSGLRVRYPNVTIAGESAPGQGIDIINFGLVVSAPNAIIRHIRVRPGDAMKGTSSEGGFSGDSISITNSDVIVDHVSTSWGIDETLSVSGSDTQRVTVQYSTISEGLSQTGLYHGAWDSDFDPGGPSRHGHGSLIKPSEGDSSISFHHNLWSNNDNRNPAVGTYNDTDTLQVDIRNNVMYNDRSNGYSSGISEWVHMNYVGNYVISGPTTNSNAVAFQANSSNNMTIYQSGNLIDRDKDGQLDGTANPFYIIQGTYTSSASPIPMQPVTTDTAGQAYDNVLAGAGAFFWNRDAVDQRLINEVMAQQGQIINSQSDVGGYPVLQACTRAANWDTDADGMPDWWEESIDGLDPLQADNNGDLDGNGYTNLEDYLHTAALGSMLDPFTPGIPGDVNLDGNVTTGTGDPLTDDVAAFIAGWQTVMPCEDKATAWSKGDLNLDGASDLLDVFIMRTALLNAGLSVNLLEQLAAVPEPASFSLTLFAFFAGTAFHRPARRR